MGKLKGQSKAKKANKPAKLAGKKAKLSPKEMALGGTTVINKSVAWEIIKETIPVVLDLPKLGFWIMVFDAEDTSKLTEFRNTGKTVGEIYYADQAKPGVQGDVVVLVLRK